MLPSTLNENQLVVVMRRLNWDRGRIVRNECEARKRKMNQVTVYEKV